MQLEVGQFYILRVDNLQPVAWEDFGETLNPDDLVYVVHPYGKDLFTVSDVRVRIGPKARESAQNKTDQGVLLERIFSP